MKRKVMKKILETKIGILTFYAVVMPTILMGASIGATILWLGSEKT